MDQVVARDLEDLVELEATKDLEDLDTLEDLTDQEDIVDLEEETNSTVVLEGIKGQVDIVDQQE